MFYTMNFQLNLTAKSLDQQTCTGPVPALSPHPNCPPLHACTSKLRLQKLLSAENLLFCHKYRFTGNSHRKGRELPLYRNFPFYK